MQILSKIFVPIDVNTFKVTPPEEITKEKLKKYSDIHAWKFNLALLTDIGLIALAIFISEYFWFNPYIFILSVILIGARMHGLAILMHDTTHTLAYKTRSFNLYIGELIAWYLAMPMSGYRINHLLHHKNLILMVTQTGSGTKMSFMFIQNQNFKIFYLHFYFSAALLTFQ